MTREEFQHQLAQLAPTYQASPEVLSKIHGLKLLIIVGPSGVGKTTIINKLGLRYIPSDNSRVKRPEEVEGVDYYFRNDYDTIIDEIKQGKFIQVAVGPDGELKATRASMYPDSGVAVMAVVADVVPIFRQLGFGETVCVFITPPSYSEWMQRMLVHDLTPEQFGKRIEEAKRSLAFAINDAQTHLILNDDVELAIKQINNLLAGQVDSQREADAKAVALALLEHLNQK